MEASPPTVSPPHWYRQRVPQLALAVLVFLLPLAALPLAWSQAVQRQPVSLRGQQVERLESAAAEGSSVLYMELAGGLLLRSLDGGVSSQRIDSGLPHSGLGWTRLVDWSAPAEGPWSLVALVQRGEAAEIFASPDRGNTWQALTRPAGAADASRLRALATGPGGWLAAAGQQTLWISQDAGQSWVVGGPLPDGLRGGRALWLRGGRPLLVASSGAGVWTSRDSGASWALASGLPPLLEVGALAVAPDRTGLIYAGGRGLVFVSQDGGLTWSAAELPGARGLVRALLVDARVGETALAADNDGRLFRSDDGGRRWEALSDSQQPVTALAIDARGRQRLFSAGGDGVWAQSIALQQPTRTPSPTTTPTATATDTPTPTPTTTPTATPSATPTASPTASATATATVTASATRSPTATHAATPTATASATATEASQTPQASATPPPGQTASPPTATSAPTSPPTVEPTTSPR